MDLGIKNKTALVCASSQGLGLACAIALAREGVNVVINGRDQERLEKATQEIQTKTGRVPQSILADITTESGRETIFKACPVPDILINNNAGPAPGQLSDWNHDVWKIGRAHV